MGVIDRIKKRAKTILELWHGNRTETTHALRLGLSQQLLRLKRIGARKLDYELAVKIIDEYEITKTKEEKAVRDGKTQIEMKKILLACKKNNKSC